MADLRFVDENGTPYAGTNPQTAPQTILNYHPIIIDILLDDTENRAEGEVWVENAMVATFDTNDDPVFTFFSATGNPENNQFFIQAGDVIRAEIQRIDGSIVTPIEQELQTNRLQPPNIDGGNFIDHVSDAHVITLLDRLEFKNVFNLTHFNFFEDITDYINLESVTSVGYGGGYGYATPVPDRDLSYARRIQNVKEYIDF